ncbi:beta-ketoacyl-ACP synthase II [Thermodesulfobacteriota bacterium]
MQHKVMVTGMGIVSCLGSGLAANWEALEAGRSGIGPITLFDASRLETRIAGEAPSNFDPEGCVPKKELRRLDRYQQFSLVAAEQAVNDAGLQFPPEDPYRCGVVIGSGIGGLASLEEGFANMIKRGPKGPHPLMILKVVINLSAGLVSIKYGIKGPNFGIVNACTSGASGLGEAYRLVKEGRADLMIAGGTEAVITELAIAGFNRLRALSIRNDEPERASRPFDLKRDGFVIAEGAGIMVLESEEHAKQRGARAHAEFVGYGSTGDAYHMVMPDPEAEAATRTMQIAVEDAEVDPSEVDYINAHGTSTDLNDAMETLAIKKLLGSKANDVAISSTKSMTGHMIGAAGAAEAIFSIMAMKKGVVPPTINLENPDPQCNLDYTPNKAVARKIDYALSNSFAFGGQNASLLFKRLG